MDYEASLVFVQFQVTSYELNGLLTFSFHAIRTQKAFLLNLFSWNNLSGASTTLEDLKVMSTPLIFLAH